MSNPDHTAGTTAGTPSSGGIDRAVSPAWRGKGSSTDPAAHRTPGVPVIAPGTPGVPDLAVGAVEYNPDAAPTVHQADDDPGWAASVTGRCAHYIAEGAIRVEHHSRRPAAYGVCGVHGFIDEQGLDEGARLSRCSECGRLLAREVDWS